MENDLLEGLRQEEPENSQGLAVRLWLLTAGPDWEMKKVRREVNSQTAWMHNCQGQLNHDTIDVSIQEI